MAKVRVGKTTKLIREAEKDTSGLLFPSEAPAITNPIPEDIPTPVADMTELDYEEVDDVQPPKEPVDKIEIIDETPANEEAKSRSKKNFLLLALGGLALLMVANS